jgi:hypothetical protein
MNTAAWVTAGLTAGVLALYELWLAFAQRTRPQQTARSAHALMRQEWFEAVSAQPGSEILAVQTLRNSLMSASMTASTAVLALMGSLTLAAPSLRASLASGVPELTPRLFMELALLVLLFASLAASVMSVRYYTHASFIGGMPVDSRARGAWSAAGAVYVRKAGVLYGWGLRNLVLIAPVVAFILHPYAGPPVAVLVVGVLFGFDRTPDAGADPVEAA